MIIIVGFVVVILCVFGGFVMEGGKLVVLVHAFLNEVIIIAGGAFGALVVMWGRLLRRPRAVVLLSGRNAHPTHYVPSFFCTRASKRATLTTTLWCEPSPMGSLSSRAATRKDSVRPSTAISSAVA